MGAETSVFQECQWGETIEDRPWTIKHGRLPDDSEISLFALIKNDKTQADLLRKLAKQLRTVRHPTILHYVCCDEGPDGPRLMTEKVVPLESTLSTLSAIEICAGLQNILEGLAFLHDQANASHNNLHLGSIYVASDGSWRLGGLEFVAKFSDITAEFLEKSQSQRNENSITPEEKQQGSMTLSQELGHTRDVYALAVMVEGLLERMDDLGDLTKTFELRIQDECLHSDPRKRPKVTSLLEDRLFTTEFLQIASFLKHITLKSEDERKYFFIDLLAKLLKLPEELVGRRLVPDLLSRFVMLDPTAVEHLLPSLLTPCPDGTDIPEIPSGPMTPLFQEFHYRAYVVPKLVKMFCVHDLHIRKILLTYLMYYVHLIDKNILELNIFPQVLLGLRDTSDEIASLSLHALAEMVPILGRDIVIGGKSKTYFKEGMPKKTEGSVTTNGPSSLNHRGPTQVSPTVTNVKGVLGKVKLKDLARMSSDNHITRNEDEKWKEREKKREEMKKRREERKLAREKQKIESAQNKKESDSKTARLSNTDEDSENVQSSQSRSDIISVVSFDKSDDQSADNDQVQVNITKESVMDIQEDSHVGDHVTDETEKSDWSDWEDTRGGDSDISDEIEKELQSMDRDELSKPETQAPSFIYADLPKQGVESPVSRTVQHSSLGGGMKLSTKKPKKQSDSVSSEKDSKTAQLIEAEIKSIESFYKPDKETKVSSSVKKPPHKKPEALGAHFDIKALDIKVSKPSSDPFDFFADMAPKIEVKPDALSLLQAEHDGISSGTAEGVKSAGGKAISFDVQDIEPTEDGGGWGEEDW